MATKGRARVTAAPHSRENADQVEIIPGPSAIGARVFAIDNPSAQTFTVIAGMHGALEFYTIHPGHIFVARFGGAA